MISQSDYIPTTDSTIAALQTVIVALGTEIAGLQKTLEVMRDGYESNATMVVDSLRSRGQGLEGELAATRNAHDVLLKEHKIMTILIENLQDEIKETRRALQLANGPVPMRWVDVANLLLDAGIWQVTRNQDGMWNVQGGSRPEWSHTSRPLNEAVKMATQVVEETSRA